ncbi:hypothetical protein WJX84_012428 [Apatococcus fuscideae]|uniref:Uncharacterized protein n=1 Tax=Apatococcus fuscideae TaxID=2026836 RepID=A0AAW1T896_9CHLO
MLTFVARTAASATSPGLRQSVQHEQYFCHIQNLGGLIAAVFVDEDYPSRPAFSIAKHVITRFDERSRDSWREQEKDCTLANDILEDALQEFQDPAKADKIFKLTREVDDIKVIMHKNIDTMLDRGEKIDVLVAKSNDLSSTSKVFYKQAKKTKRCCIIM